MKASKTTKKIPHRDFAQRMALAADGNPHIPGINYGRLGWVAEQFQTKFDRTITNESVRKWFAGEAYPRKTVMPQLAAILGVDEGWLASGGEASDPRARRLQNAQADGAVNVLAGFIKMNGSAPAFPDENDQRAESQKVDLYAIIRGAQYSIHVCLEQDGEFRVPIEALDTVVIGVRPTAPLSCDFYELDRERVESSGVRKGGSFVVAADAGWRKIESFAERL